MGDYRQGTADDEISGAIKLEGQAGKFNWHVDGYQQDTNDIDIPGSAESAALEALEEEEGEEHEQEADGKLQESATRSRGTTVGGSYVWQDGFIGTSVTAYGSKYGIPGHAHEEEEHEHEEEQEHGEEAVAIDLEQWRVDVRGEVRNVSESIEKARFKFGYSNYDHKELEGDEVGTRFENNAGEGRVEVVHVPVLGFQGVIGTQLNASEFEAIGEEALVPGIDRFSPAVFLFEELPFDDFWKLQLGGRYEHVNLDAEGFSSEDFNPFSLSTGVVWDPIGSDDYIVGLSFAVSERAPSGIELYADGPHIARQIFEVGDSSLDNEHSYGFDLTFRKNTGLVTGAASFFFQEYDDYINLTGNGGEEDGLPVFMYEDIRARFWGFEVESTVHLHEVLNLWAHDLDFDVQVDMTRGKNRTASDDLSRIPPVRTLVRLRYDWKNTIGAQVEGIFVEEQNKTSNFELPTDSYQLLNASTHYNAQINNDYGLTFYVRGTNLTDEEARIHSSFIKDLAPLRGRSLLFGVRGEFG